VSSLWESDAPIRSELFSAERLEQHAESLATAQRIVQRPGIGRPLAKRLRDNDKALLDAYRTIAKATRDDDPITPAAEWLVDNFHVVEAQIRGSGTIFRPHFTASCPNWRTVHSPAIRVYSELPGPSSLIPTVDSIQRCCVGLCRPTSA